MSATSYQTGLASEQCSFPRKTTIIKHQVDKSESKQCLGQTWLKAGVRLCSCEQQEPGRILPRPVKKRHSAPGPAALVDSFWNSLEGSDGFNLSTPALHCNLAGERVVCGPLLFGGSGYRWNLF